MLHILTVHWEDDRWIDVQLSYLQRHITELYRVYAFLNYIPEHHFSKFFYVSNERIDNHAVKLNLLADMAVFASKSDDDVLMFIDGDAFPIGDMSGFIRQNLAQYPLAAVQRLENNGDIQPHPCFCVTTVGLWKSIRGDWNRGYKWPNAYGELVSDVGGNLYGQLLERNIPWLPILRTNKINLHPLWFGIYGDVVYHHGAGFRDPQCRLEIRHLSRKWEWWIIKAFRSMPRRGIFRRFHEKWNFMYHIVRRRFVAQNQQLSSHVFDRMVRDPEFFRMFQEPQGEPALCQSREWGRR